MSDEITYSDLEELMLLGLKKIGLQKDDLPQAVHDWAMRTTLAQNLQADEIICEYLSSGQLRELSEDLQVLVFLRFWIAAEIFHSRSVRAIHGQNLHNTVEVQVATISDWYRSCAEWLRVRFG